MLKVIAQHRYAVVAKFGAEGEVFAGYQNGVLAQFAAGSYEQLRSVQAHKNIIRQIVVARNCLLTCSND